MWWCRPISAYCGNAPTVTIGNVTSISYTSATVTGNVTDDGGATITSRGVCYGTSYDPTISGNKVISGSGTGSFSANLTGLTAGTTYYVRAYATNTVGTGYSTNATFTTTAISVPSVTTVSVGTITSNSAIVTGNATAENGSSITERGICWNSTGIPTIANSRSSAGPGTGSIAITIGSLSANTTYYARAYATNSAGTGYGATLSFTTAAAVTVPTVTTGTASSVTSNSADVSGNVTASGGATVTERGICYGTSANPTVSGAHVASGSGTGSFTASLTGLTASTTYYVRAYATNSVGTAYGTQTSFDTSSSSVTLPNPIFNLDIANMTYSAVKDTISNRNLTSTTNSSYLEFVTDSTFGRGYKTKTRTSYNVYSAAYNQTNFPALYNVLNNSTAAFSVLMIIDPRSTGTSSGKSNRQGLLALYNFLSFIGYTDGANNKLLQAFMPKGTAGGTGSAIASYFQPIGNTGISYFYVGIDTNGTYYYDANGVLQTNTTIKRNGVAGTPVSGSQLVLNRSQEKSYYAQAGQIIYGITIYDDILTPDQIDYLVNQNHTTYISQ